MLIILLATILILAMTAFLLSQGLFSSMITAVLSMLCAAFALNAYPALASEFFYASQGPLADGAAITILFVIPLIAVRLLADFLVPKNVEFTPWVDRIGGGAFGLLASMTMVGMVLVIMQTLPFGSTVIGYQPYDASLQRSQRVWPFCPDDFAASLGSMGSVGAFGGQGSFNDLHVDFLREAAASRNSAASNGTTFATPESLSIRSAYLPEPETMETLCSDIPADPFMLDNSNSKVLVVGVSISSDASDEDNKIRLAGTQLRLVARATKTEPNLDGDKVTMIGGPIDHYPVGYFLSSGKPPKWRPKKATVDKDVAQVGSLLFTIEKNKAKTVYWIYKIGRDEMPDYMVFRRVSRKEVPRPKPGMPKLPKPKTPPTEKKP